MAFDVSRSLSSQGLVQEHRHLRTMLQGIHEELARGQPAGQCVALLLGDLVREIHNHFTREERSGYYAEVLEVAPQLGNQIERLRVQHGELLGSAEHLRSAIASVDAEVHWMEFVEAFHDFTFRFLEHEVDENSLLHEAYNRDIGAED
jgi:hypothetical protein